MALWVATPKDEGFAAYHQGIERCINPYPPGTREAELWVEGWDKAHNGDLGFERLDKYRNR